MCGPAVSVPTVLIIGSGLAINVVQIVSIYRECRDTASQVADISKYRSRERIRLSLV